MASLEHYLATTYRPRRPVPPVRVGTSADRAGRRRSRSTWPWRRTTPSGVPSWCEPIAAPTGACEIAAARPVVGDGGDYDPERQPVSGAEPGTDGYLRFRREWSVGDELVVEFPLRPRVVRASDDIDGVRGCVAFESGPARVLRRGP